MSEAKVEVSTKLSTSFSLEKLYAALEEGDGKLVQQLILQDEKASIAALKKDGYTDLHIAIMKDEYKDVVSRVSAVFPLIAPQLSPLLHLAARLGRLSIVKWLIEKIMVDHRLTDLDGRNALQLAEKAKHEEVVSCLRFYIGVWEDDVQTVAELEDTPFSQREIDQPQSNLDSSFDETLRLAIAVCNPNLNIVKHLVKKRAAVEEKQDYYNAKEGLRLFLCCPPAAISTILRHAVHCNNLPVVRYLIEQEGVNPSSYHHNCKGNLLHSAIAENHIELAKYLATKMDPQRFHQAIKGSLSENALHVAVRCGHLKLVDFFIKEKGLDFNRTTNNVSDKKRHTPLFLAARHGHKEIAQYLSAFSPPTKEDMDKILPIAVEKGHTDIVKHFLEDKKAVGLRGFFKKIYQREKPPDLLKIAARFGQEETFQYLLAETDAGEHTTYQEVVDAAVQGYHGYNRTVTAFLYEQGKVHIKDGVAYIVPDEKLKKHIKEKTPQAILPPEIFFGLRCSYFLYADPFYRDLCFLLSSFLPFHSDLSNIIMDYIKIEKTTLPSRNIFDPLDFPNPEGPQAALKTLEKETQKAMEQFKAYHETRQFVLSPMKPYPMSSVDWEEMPGFLNPYMMRVKNRCWDEWRELGLIEIREQAIEYQILFAAQTDAENSAIFGPLAQVIENIDQMFSLPAVMTRKLYYRDISLLLPFYPAIFWILKSYLGRESFEQVKAYHEMRLYVLSPLQSSPLLSATSLLEEWSALGLCEIREQAIERQKLFATKKDTENSAILAAITQVIAHIDQLLPLFFSNVTISEEPVSIEDSATLSIVVEDAHNGEVYESKRSADFPPSKNLSSLSIIDTLPSTISLRGEEESLKQGLPQALLTDDPPHQPAASQELEQKAIKKPDVVAFASKQASLPPLAGDNLKDEEKKASSTEFVPSHKSQIYSTFRFSLFERESVYDAKEKAGSIKGLSAAGKRALAPAGIAAVVTPLLFGIGSLVEFWAKTATDPLNFDNTLPGFQSAEAFFDSTLVIIFLSVAVALMSGVVMAAVHHKLTVRYEEIQPEIICS